MKKELIIVARANHLREAARATLTDSRRSLDLIEEKELIIVARANHLREAARATIESSRRSLRACKCCPRDVI